MKEVSGKEIRTRFAPSPTGPLHIGGVRTALFNWLFARQNGGVFVLRIEDTDKERSQKKYEEEIIEGLKWLGLDWDEGLLARNNAEQTQNIAEAETEEKGDYGPYRQSERREIYKKYLEKLLAEDKAYWCYCSPEKLKEEAETLRAQGLPPKYSGHCRRYTDKNRQNTDLDGKIQPPAGAKSEVIRFKTPEVEVKFEDLIRGKVSFDASLFGDIIIAKDLESPLYNFAAVVDDSEMKISHVIRGEEHLSNTPKQILLQKALGFGEIVYAHLPLILNPDRSKMSKRFADTALMNYKESGYLPEAIINFLALLGWHPAPEQSSVRGGSPGQAEKEIFTKEELIKEFDLKRVQKAGAIFNQEKLDWLNAHYLRELSAENIFSKLEPELKNKFPGFSEEMVLKIIEEEKPRLKKLSDFFELSGFFFKLPDYESGLLAWKNAPAEKTKNILRQSLEILKNIPEEKFNRNFLLESLKELTEKEGRGDVLWSLRAALSGQKTSPDPSAIMEILGKKETIFRMESALEK